MKHLISLFLLFISFSIYAQNGPKILISVDMEGLAGAVTDAQLGPGGFEYERFRTFMTNEALAAIKGAKSAGAGEILVADSHGNGQNLLIEKFPDDIEIIRSWPRRFHMMAGIDESIDGVMLIGYHASTNNKKGVRAHTFSSARLTDVKINGQSMSEGTWGAIVAGHFGAPIILVTGDNIATQEVKDFTGDVEEVVVKEALSFHSAKTMTPNAAVKLIQAASERAVRRIKDFKPYEISTPVTLDVSFKHYRPTEALDYLPVFERTNSHTIRYVGKDMTEVADVFEFLMEYSSYLEP